MNKYIAQGDGFPADNEFLMLIQSIIGEVAQLTALGGNSYILKGCEEAGGNVADGWLVLDGELIPFTGGVLGADVTIDEAVENANYLEDLDEDDIGDAKPTYFTRTARFGNDGVSTYQWDSLERITPILDIKKALMPIGGVIQWAGAINAIPDGWALCDGTNGTPNLKGKFLVGYDSAVTEYNAPGKTGGTDEVVLAENEMPQHSHNGTVTIPAHSHTTTGWAKTSQSVDNGSGAVVADSGGNSAPTGSGGGGSVAVNTNSKGGNQPHENRPPFYVVAYIQYKGV